MHMAASGPPKSVPNSRIWQAQHWACMKLPPVTCGGPSTHCRREACGAHLLVDEQRSGVGVRLVELVLARREGQEAHLHARRRFE